MFTQLHVEHFKSLADVDIELGGVTIFVGRNSVGKSNVIEACLFLRDSLERGLDSAVSDRYGIDSILQWSRFKPFRMVVRVHVNDSTGSGVYALKVSSKKREPIVVAENAWWRNADVKSGVSFNREGSKITFSGLTKDYERFFPSAEYMSDDELLLSRLRHFPTGGTPHISRLYRSLASIQSYSIYPNVIREPQRPSRDSTLTESGDNLTSVLKAMTASKSIRTRRGYAEIVSTMRKIMPSLERILVRTLSGLLWLAFEVKESDGTLHQLNTTQISDGALRILGILVALYQPAPPRVLAIEEPEQNLHPGALGLLAEALKEQAGETQLIVTTHSPHLIDHFDVDDIRTITSEGGSSRIDKISEYQRETVKKGLLSAGELMTTQGFLPL